MDKTVLSWTVQEDYRFKLAKETPEFCLLLNLEMDPILQTNQHLSKKNVLSKAPWQWFKNPASCLSPPSPSSFAVQKLKVALILFIIIETIISKSLATNIISHLN